MHVFLMVNAGNEQNFGGGGGGGGVNGEYFLSNQCALDAQKNLLIETFILVLTTYGSAEVVRKFIFY